MAEPVIDLRRIRYELKGGAVPEPERELSPPYDPELLETEAMAHSAAAEADHGPVLLAWEAPEFERDETGAAVLLLVGVGLGLGGLVAIFFASALFAIFLFIAGGLAAASAFRAARALRLTVTARGVVVGNRRYEFEDLESFWILYNPPLFRELIIESRRAVMPVIRAPLGELDPLRLREVLLRFLPEERYEPTLLDIIGKRLGF